MEKNIELGGSLKKALDEAEIGKKVTMNFSGIPSNINVEMIFKDGWIVNQTILHGKSFELTKGEDGYLETINITMNSFEGIQSV